MNRSPFPPRINSMVEEDQMNYIGWGYGYVSDSTLHLAYLAELMLEGEGYTEEPIHEEAA